MTHVHMVGTIGKKLIKLVFILYFEFYLPWIESSIACIGTSNLAITLSFTLDVKLPASRADRLFLIAFEAQ